MTTSEIGMAGPGLARGLEPTAGGLAAAREQVCASLSAAVGADGAVRRPCASRALESALMLVLLRRRGGHVRQEQELAEYLATPQAQAGGFDAALVQAVLHGRRIGVDVVGGELLAGFDHFSLARKRLLFDVYLAVAGAVPFEASMLRPHRTADRGADNTVTWIEMIMLSVRILVAHGLGEGAQVDDGERARLLELLGSSRAPVWENYTAAHLLALLAVQEFAPGHRLVETGVAAVLACRDPDGGVPSMSNLDVFSTGPAGLALARAGADRGLLHRMCDYLIGRQMPDGGWAFGEDMRHSDVDASSYAAACLAAVDPVRHREALVRAGGYFRGVAGLDGGFPTYMKGDPSEVGMTGGAVSALAWNATGHGDLLDGAARWLLDAQHQDGTFERSWSLSEANTIWRAMWALHSIPEPTRTTLKARIADASAASHRFLAQAQNTDGGWGYRPGDASDTSSTCYSLLALAAMDRCPQEDPVVRAGIAHLLSRQEPDGTFTALPDQVAPRPLLFDAPVFTDIWVLLALAGFDSDETR
ncbi:prenyltransferase/squalene oxidase repeat-containing protein [Streptacidiphilus albus]|uniref:prenyltransferase/squalene oxidase repeat-containing protein n=1 Tax=Streptacidiphilus albus TaxID=105425 RepID=UPI00128D154D|nr:prenyltransferase/squalene oxidase repeat-containing protein [Streptacidiphilus albus]